MWSYQFVLRDVSCVISGSSVDGVTQLPKAVSFPKRREIVDATVSLTQVLYMIVGTTQRGLADDHPARTAIVFKLLAYLTKTGRMTPDAIRGCIQDVAGIAVVLSERPELIFEAVNFTNLLARHTQAQQERATRRAKEELARISQAAAAPRPRAPRPRRIAPVRIGNRPRPPVRIDNTPPAPVPMRPVVWRSDDGYCLQELTHPWHLVEETDALGHCVGRHGARYSGPGGLEDLTYWQYIKAGRSRIFSFARECGLRTGPLCTLHVHVPTSMLVEAGPAVPKVLTEKTPYFAALAISLTWLETALGRRLCIGTSSSVKALRYWHGGKADEMDDEVERCRVRPRRRLLDA